MNKQGFIGLLMNVWIWLFIIVIAGFFWLSTKSIPITLIAVVLAGIIVGVWSNLVFDHTHTFFIAFAIALLVTAYDVLSNSLNLFLLPDNIIIFVWAILFGAVISRFSLMLTGVGT
tara:strand:+ start:100 stop:447 length:348 start_codon:yes stop_codon:yes gene_type:complete